MERLSCDTAKTCRHQVEDSRNNEKKRLSNESSSRQCLRWITFEPSNRVTLLGLLKNPMVLMVLMTVIMAVAQISLIRNMDPEALEELKKEMGKGNVFQQMAAANKAMDASVEKQVNSKFGVKEEKVGGGKNDEKK